MPANPTPAAISTLVDELYADLPVGKREAKKRDLQAFLLGMREDDLVATVEGGSLRVGRLQAGVPTLTSIGGSTVLTRAVTWLADVRVRPPGACWDVDVGVVLEHGGG